ncbi:hypothetical protein ACFLQL_01580 [Verrucomicrobiota bacterium]
MKNKLHIICDIHLGILGTKNLKRRIKGMQKLIAKYGKGYMIGTGDYVK